MVRYPKIKPTCRQQTVPQDSTMMFRILQSCLYAGCIALPSALMILSAGSSYAQSITVEDESLPTLPTTDLVDETEGLEDLRPLAQDGSLLSIGGGEQLVQQAQDAAARQDYATAVDRLQEARQVFNQLSNFYQRLSGTFSGIDSRINDELRVKALDTAQLRDQATYQLALVHRAQNQSDLAVPLLIQIVRSQQPTRELGQQAYRQLFELGFVALPYPSVSEDTETAEPLPTPTTPSGTLLSIQSGEQLMQQGQEAAASEDYTTAADRLQEARQVFNQLSNLYQQLSESFSGVDVDVNSYLRTQALDTAQMRDQSTYQLALVHRAQNQPELAVPLLIQIVQSQAPTRELGQRAYQQLFELGFVNSPYPREATGGGAVILNPSRL